MNCIYNSGGCENITKKEIIVITTKTCLKCGIEKTTDSFRKNSRNKNGLHNWCKICTKEYQKRYRKSYDSIIRNRWCSINQRCVNGCYKTPTSPQFQSYIHKGVTVNMTKDEFTAWMKSVEHIHNQIVENGAKSSIDRIDETKGYEIGNLQLISLHANIEKRYGKVCNYQPSEDKPKKTIENRTIYLNFKTREI